MLKYNPDKLFKNKPEPSQAIEEKTTEKVELVEYKESILKRIVKKILSIFKR